MNNDIVIDPNPFPVDPTPPGPAPAPPAPVDTVAVKAAIATFMSVARAVSKATPTQVDDSAVAFLDRFVNEDWFVQVVSALMSLYRTRSNATASDIRAVLTAHFGGR